MEEKESLQHQEDTKNKAPNKEKAYPIRNFIKELKRVTWPTSKRNYKYFFLVFVFIIFLIIFFALISWAATEILKAMGVI